MSRKEAIVKKMKLLAELKAGKKPIKVEKKIEEKVKKEIKTKSFEIGSKKIKEEKPEIKKQDRKNKK